MHALPHYECSNVRISLQNAVPIQAKATRIRQCASDGSLIRPSFSYQPYGSPLVCNCGRNERFPSCLPGQSVLPHPCQWPGQPLRNIARTTTMEAISKPVIQPATNVHETYSYSVSTTTRGLRTRNCESRPFSLFSSTHNIT